MGTRDTYQRVLLKACQVAGDEIALAKRLGVPPEQVVNWLLGDGQRLPVDVFLAAVDIVLAASKQHVIEARALLEAIRSRYRNSR